MATRPQQLDPTQRSPESRELEVGLQKKIVGQAEAVQAVVDLYRYPKSSLASRIELRPSQPPRKK